MIATFLPLLSLDPSADFASLRAALVLHAIAPATQDVAIDALSISVTPVSERAGVSGWVQAGMLGGRAAFGGGALAVAARFGDEAAVIPLLALILAALAFLLVAVPRGAGLAPGRGEGDRFGQTLAAALRARETWAALVLALVAGLGFESVVAAHLCLTAALLAVAASGSIVTLGAVYAGIGLFTATSYALLMSATRPGLAATRFSGYMGATNAGESPAAFATSRLLAPLGYGGTCASLALFSLAALPLVGRLSKRR